MVKGGYEFHQRFKGSNNNWLIFSRRYEKDYHFRVGRFYCAVNMNLYPNPQEVTFEYSITRSALASQNVNNIVKNPEIYIAQSGLTRFKRLLKENDSVSSYPDCNLTRDSPENEFKIPLMEDKDNELMRVRYEVLNVLSENKYLDIKRTQKEDLKDRICTHDKILDQVLVDYEETNFIDGAYASTGIKITINGERRLDEIKREMASNQGNSVTMDGLGFGAHDWSKSS